LVHEFVFSQLRQGRSESDKLMKKNSVEGLLDEDLIR